MTLDDISLQILGPDASAYALVLDAKGQSFASVPVNEARLLLTPALADKVEQAYAARRGKQPPGGSR